jgi:hypothetical protein
MAFQIALTSGHWGQNIGNAFFNIGGRWVLEQVFPEADICFILDQPGYRTFHNKHSGNPPNDFGLMKYLDVDLLVLQGPLLTDSFPVLWRETLQALKDRGVKYGFMSTALFRHTPSEVEVNRRFIEEFPPAFLSTRDTETYEHFKDLAPVAYDGIDSAFFTPEASHPPKLTCAPYVVMNFDRWPEPRVQIDAAPPRIDSQDFIFEGQTWHLDAPGLFTKMADKNKYASYIAAFMDRRQLPNSLGKRQIVRTEHRVNPFIGPKVYKRPNMVCSDEPWTYLTVYANSALTVTDRVHACAATLAFGGPSILFAKTSRARLFDRVGAGKVLREVVQLPLESLEAERRRQIEFLATNLRGLSGA